jgi:hypothetical protein
MQMENIFEKIRIPNYYFDSISITTDLFDYLLENIFENENEFLTMDLEMALKINANEKNI